MNCNLVKKVKKVQDRTFVNYYVHFEDNGILIPVMVKELPMPKALEKNADSKAVKEYEEEVEFRKFINSKFKTQLDTMATLLKDED